MLSLHSLDVGILQMKTNYISIYENALSDDECDTIINEFDKNKKHQRKGRSGNGKIQKKTKMSTDITYSIETDCVTSNILSKSLDDHIQKYITDYPDVDYHMNKWSCVPDYNIQRYNPGEGFYKPHCENCDKLSSYRVLVWMFYLNTVPDGGTLFPTLEIGIKANKGRLVVWPAYWTHIHMGEISNRYIKYIATGWYGYS